MKQIRKILFALMIIFMTISFTKIDCRAAQIIIEDEADLLTEEQEQELRITMEKIAEYGSVAFISNSNNNEISSASAYAKSKCREYFNGESATVLLIDMYNRRIEIYSTGYIYKVIGKNRANAITDNTYVYATKGSYFRCANESFNQMLTVLEGGHISAPMKFVSNILMAFGVSVMFFYVILFCQRRSAYKVGKDINLEEYYKYAHKNVIVTKQKMVSRRKTRHVESSDSSGGGYSGGGSSSSGGGGSSSGGGGGHSF